MRRETVKNQKMKKLNLLKIALFSIATLMLIGTVLGSFIPEVNDFMTVIVGTGGGGMLANVALAGEPVTFDKSDSITGGTHKERHISEVVTMMRPDEFPLDTMIRQVRKAEEAKNVKVEYETVQLRKRQDTVTEPFTAAGDATDQNVLLTVANIGIWGLHDTLIVPSVLGWDGNPMGLLVIEVKRSDNQIRVTALNGASEANFQRVKSIGDNAEIKRIGVAKYETDSVTDVVTQFPTQDYNYTQIQMAYLEQSKVNAVIQAYSKYGYKDLVYQELYNFRSSCNHTNWFGTRAKVINPITSKPHYTAGGIWNKITKKTLFNAGGGGTVTITLADILTLLKDTFSDNAGSSKRILFAGDQLILGIQNVTFDKNMMSKETEIVHGVMCTKLVSDFGVLYIKHEKAFDQVGYNKYGAVIDLEHVFKHDLEAMKKEAIDPDKSGEKRVQDAFRLLENSCLTLRYPDVHRKWEPDPST